MVFFQPTGAPSRDLVRVVGEELAVFGVGGRIRETGPAPLRSVAQERTDAAASAQRPEAGAIALEPRPGRRVRRAVRPETRSAYRPMVFADEETAAPRDAGAAASVAQASGPQPPAPPIAPAEPVGVWRLRREFPHELRVLADSSDRPAWLAHRARGVTATDAARLATEASVRQVVRDKVRGSGFTGNAYTDFGRAREPHIAAWVAERHGIDPCGLLFHAEASRAHLATPDGLHCDEDGRVTLAEIKTTNKPWSRIPRTYLRQVWWQQYVLGAERTLFVWERHRDFVIVDEEPRFVWIERDDAEIERMARLADAVLEQVEELRAQLEPPN